MASSARSGGIDRAIRAISRHSLGLICAGALVIGVVGFAFGAPQAATVRTATVPVNGLAKTPPMGFNDWNAFGCHVSEKLIKQTADVMVGSGLKAAGYTYVNIDDCWMAKARSSTGHLVPDPAKFPDGIRGTAAFVHAKGLKLGIYEDAGVTTCAGYPGSLGHEQTDADDFAAWGVDYLKYDNCDHRGDAGRAGLLARYTAMGTALQHTGRKIVYSICEWGLHNPAAWAGRVGNLWRTTHDIKDRWARLKSIIAHNSRLARHAHPGAWNDPDMLEVGNGGMTTTEYKTHFGLWAEMAAPLLIGTDLRKATPSTLAILTNRRVIAVDQDRLGVQGHVVARRHATMVFTKPLANGDSAVALYNAGNSVQTISTSAARAGLARARRYAVTDLWTGRTTTTSGSITAAVPPHGTALYRVRAVRRP